MEPPDLVLFNFAKKCKKCKKILGPKKGDRNMQNCALELSRFAKSEKSEKVHFCHFGKLVLDSNSKMKF